jgi:DNA-binding NarL/FixJ family response regulator
MCLAERVASDREREPLQPTNGKVFTVVVVAPHQASRRSVVTGLAARADIEVVKEVEDAVAATEAAVHQRPDFVLLDARLPDLDDACRWINRGADSVGLVLLRSEDANDPVGRAVGTGAAAVPEPCTLDEFLASVQALGDGGSALDPFAARIAVATVRRTTHLSTPAHPRLTEREWEVLQLRARGTLLREIARQLYVSENTVRNHFLRIREKVRGMTTE